MFVCICIFVCLIFFASPTKAAMILETQGTKLANILCPISRFLCFSCDLIGSKWVFSTLGRWGQLRASILEITFYHVGRAQGWKLWVAPPLQRKMLVKFPYFVYCSDCIFSKSQVIVWDVWEFWSMKRITSHLVWLLHRWHISLKVFLGHKSVIITNASAAGLISNLSRCHQHILRQTFGFPTSTLTGT